MNLRRAYTMSPRKPRAPRAPQALKPLSICLARHPTDCLPFSPLAGRRTAIVDCASGIPLRKQPGSREA